MKVSIDAKSVIPISEQIFNQIRLAIASGELENKNKLPSVRALSEELHVAANTVAKAYYKLNDMGYVRLNGRDGTIVSDQWKKKKKNKVSLDRLNELGMEYILATIEHGWDFTTLVSHMVKLSEKISGKKML